MKRNDNGESGLKMMESLTFVEPSQEIIAREKSSWAVA